MLENMLDGVRDGVLRVRRVVYDVSRVSERIQGRVRYRSRRVRTMCQARPQRRRDERIAGGWEQQSAGDHAPDVANASPFLVRLFLAGAYGRAQPARRSAPASATPSQPRSLCMGIGSGQWVSAVHSATPPNSTPSVHSPAFIQV